MNVQPDNRRGLSDDDRAAIERFCSTMAKPKPGKIAQKIGRDVGTVAWYMITNGLIDRKISYGGPASYTQGGKTVFRYTEAHDKMIVALRREGKKVREIAAAVTSEFGIERTGHSIDVRLKMLAAYDGGPEGSGNPTIAGGNRVARCAAGICAVGSPAVGLGDHPRRQGHREQVGAGDPQHGPLHLPRRDPRRKGHDERGIRRRL
jgi:hypothetical protein